MRECDLLVVGLGPAGASAAREAARAGLRVIALERKPVVGLPVQCAEFIPMPIARHAQEAARAQAIRAMRTRLPSGVEAQSGFNGLMIRRDRFDQGLARAAGQAGAVLWTDAVLRALDARRRTALVSTAGALREIGWRVAIAADGPHSTVAAALGLPRLPTVNTRQYTVPLAVPHRDTDIWLSPAYPGGYAWLFPKGAVANLGLGMDPGIETDMKTPLDALHASLTGAGRLGREVLLRTGGPIPVGGLRARLAEGRVLFTGDAAGFTHPVSGAGIAPAVVSGERAGAAAADWLGGDAGALGHYEDEMREQFEAALERGVRARERMRQHWGRASAGEDDVHRAGWIAFPEYFAEDRQ